MSHIQKLHFRSLLLSLLCATMLIRPSAAAGICSLTLNYPYDGATFQIYHVTDENQNTLKDFSKQLFSFHCTSNKQWVALADSLNRYVEKEKISPTAMKAVSQSQAVFSDLEPGLYLVTGEDHGDSDYIYHPVPFVILLSHGNAVSNVKSESEDIPTQPSIPATPSTPSAPSLPQTGQLWWPVPVLGGCGAVLLLAGLYRRTRKGAQSKNA